jgi:hypothetical protein
VIIGVKQNGGSGKVGTVVTRDDGWCHWSNRERDRKWKWKWKLEHRLWIDKVLSKFEVYVLFCKRGHKTLLGMSSSIHLDTLDKITWHWTHLIKYIKNLPN